MLATVALGSLLGVLMPGCGPYPSWSEVDDDRTYVDASTDPLSQYDDLTVDWIEIEAEPNDLPADAQQTSLQVDTAAGIETATLNGVVWDDAETHTVVEITDSDCASLTGYRNTSSIPGEYAGDVDYYGITVEAAGTLCIAGRLGDSGDDAIGWDLVLFPLAEGCNVPLDAVSREGSPWEQGILGFGRTGDVHAYATHVEAGERYALLVAGYGVDDGTDTTKNRPLLDVPYQAAWTLVADDGVNLAPCPRPDSGGSE